MAPAVLPLEDRVPEPFDERIVAIVARTRVEQGKPPKVTDPVALARIAAILVRKAS